jgi:hypothetical protein
MGGQWRPSGARATGGHAPHWEADNESGDLRRPVPLSSISAISNENLTECYCVSNNVGLPWRWSKRGDIPYLRRNVCHLPT